MHPVVPALWGIPTVLYNLYAASTMSTTSTIIAMFAAGIFFWTFAEYMLHKNLFHFHATSKWGKRIVYLFHGIHHEDPNDPTRLVMPPIAAWTLAAAFYYGFLLIMGAEFTHSFFAGFIVGYMIYDYIHYATHHFRMKSPVGKYLKQHHMRHHFKEQDIKWGVSSPLWDYILGTYSEPKKH